jgi:hypothetical protein
MALSVKNSICNFVGKRIFSLIESNRIKSIDNLLEEARQSNKSQVWLTVYRTLQSNYPFLNPYISEREYELCVEIKTDSHQYHSSLGKLPELMVGYEMEGISEIDRMDRYVDEVHEKLSNYMKNRGFEVISTDHCCETEPVYSPEDKKLIQCLFLEKVYEF